jgi:two-component system CheB/CheR fusion protein
MSMTVAVLEMRHKSDGDAPVIARLDRAVTNCVQLLNTLQEISRLEAGLVRPNLRTFNVSSLLTDLAQEFADIAEAKGIALQLDACQFAIRSDPGLLGRMLRSLIDNAIKFTPPAGRVDVFCHDHGTQLLIAVQDTGVGIPEDSRAGIFEDFHRLENPQHDGSRGPGLGLAIVERLSRLLQHPVSVHSSPGRGATFTVTVPKALDGASEGAQEGQAVRVAGRVLLAADDELVLATTAQLLSELGAQVTTAASAGEARALLDRGEYDVFIADHDLPDSSELGLVGYARERYPRILTAVITGDSSIDNLRRIADMETEIIQKPVRVDRLSRLFSRSQAA